ncbi:MAG: DUF5020 family protein [Prevotella sp.]|nr:DUF5020 family protein [Prevotella sp.]
MKRILFFALLAVAAISADAQNIQFHYDFGRNIYPDEEAGRQKVTITVEQFKADNLGSWYYFVDLDLSRKFFKSAYTEISREFNLGKQSPIAAHIEYDGGLSEAAGSFQQAALLGAAYNGHTADFSKTWSVQLLYKRFFKSYDTTRAYNSVQLTGVWGINFAGGKGTFSGFIDFWRGENWRAGKEGHGMLVILTEPQIWYNITPHISFGSEIEVSNNFIYNFYNDKSFFINPTLAFKYNF